MIRVFLGYDGKETVAYHVLAHSIISRASQPVTVAPLMLTQLKNVFTRERNALQSTDFAFSRFLVPFLSGYEGWSLFMDCDMLVLDDIANLFKLCDDKYAVMCVKHDYTPKTGEKFLGQVQTTYEKKNWSSVMLFNNAKCKALTPEYVNNATGLELHRFRWLGDDNLIGEIPMKWNFLVGEYEKIPVEQISNLHYTLGGPYFTSYKDTDYAEEWFEEREKLLFADKDVRLATPKPKEVVVMPEEQFRWAMVAFESGKDDEAREKAEALLKQHPGYGDALNLIGVVYHKTKEFEKAREWFEKATKAAPDNAHFIMNLAMVCQTLGDKKGAKDALDKTLSLAPGYVQAFQIRLQLALAEEDYETAERILKNLLPVVPATPDLLMLLITMLGRQEKYYETLPYFEELLKVQPNLTPEFSAQYGLALQKHGRILEALPHLVKAIDGGYHSPEVFYNLAIVYDQIGEHEKSLQYYERVCASSPDFLLAKAGLGLLKIKMANTRGNLELYRDRAYVATRPKRQYPFKEWRGEPLAGKRILIWGEQGIGDIVMFSGLLPYVIKQAAHVGMEMEPYMLSLMKRSFPEIYMVEMEHERLNPEIMKQKWDYHCSIADLMELVLPKYEPARHTPFLKPDMELVKQLRAKYKAINPGFRVGLSWQTIIDKNSFIRNIPFSLWKPLFSVPNCHFISLQYMDIDEAVNKVAPVFKGQNIPLTLDPDVDTIRDKAAWAAQISAMDLVISIQNSAVHMAGALNVDTMILLSKCSDWRWGLTSKQSPFYSSVEIVRQQAFGEWEPVIAAAKDGLQRRMKLAKAS